MDKDLKLFTVREKNMEKDFKSLQIEALQKELNAVKTKRLQELLKDVSKIDIVSNQQGLLFSKSTMTISNVETENNLLKLTVDVDIR